MKKLDHKQVFTQADNGTTVVKGFKYVRVPILDFYAIKADALGKSKCNFTKGETFNPKIGADLAFTRAQLQVINTELVTARRVEAELKQFIKGIISRRDALKEKEADIITSLSDDEEEGGNFVLLTKEILAEWAKK